MYFKFETDFVEPNIKCIPMIVRLKLDTCGIKLTLSNWSRMTVAEREHCATASCSAPEEVIVYGEDLRKLILNRTGAHVAEIPVEKNPSWSRTDIIPSSIADRLVEEGRSLSLHDWQALTDLQRFALLKLSYSGHERNNFSKAIAEFTLLK